MIFHRSLAEWSQWFWPVFGNHLWQATLFALVVWIAAVWLNQARARHIVRHSVWLMAFAKFLLPSVALFLLARETGLNLSGPARTEMIAAADAEVLIQFAEPVIQPAYSDAGVGHSEVYCILTAVWLIGVVMCLARWRRRRRRLAAVALAGEKLETGREAVMLEDLKSRLNVRRPIELIVSSRFAEPAVWRALRPVIVFPRGLAERLSDDELESVLTHELFHIKRFDNLLGSLQMFVCCLFWFHPLVWLIDRRLIEERELMCDERVILSGAAPEAYATGLWKVVQFGFGWPVEGVSRAAGANLKRRIKHMLNGNHRSKSSTASRALAGVTFVTLITLAVAMSLISRDVAPVAVARNDQDQSQKFNDQNQDQKFIATAPMQIENLPECPIVITEARLSVGEARARTEGAVGPDRKKILVMFREGEARDAEFQVNMVNQGNRRINGIAVEIQNAAYWGRVIIPSSPKTVADAAGAPGPVNPQESFAFKHIMLLDEHEGQGDLMRSLYDFKVRIIGLKFDLEEKWVWAEPARKPRDGEDRISIPMTMRVANNPKDEGERKIPVVDPQQAASGKIFPTDRSTRPTIFYQAKAKYTQEARDNKTEGVVILSVVFGADAQIRDIEVVQGLPGGLNDSAIEAAKTTRFEPAMKDGQPVNTRGKLQFRFSLPLDSSIRPTISYRENAQYTWEARENKVEGTVILDVIFGADGRIRVVDVKRRLPHGLTRKAIEAAMKTRFEPAMKDGQQVDVRGALEFSFNLH
ncbi:MAG TPA: M56 family metallopeptidase [Blastocatellia bacterium]|nr:M56 family metallopeptidase [Blastocatellia bacterium]